MSSVTALEDAEVQLNQCAHPSGAQNSLSPELLRQLAFVRTRTIAASDVNWDNPEHVSAILLPVLLLTAYICSQVR